LPRRICSARAASRMPDSMAPAAQAAPAATRAQRHCSRATTKMPYSRVTSAAAPPALFVQINDMQQPPDAAS
jgi:hypothetical protein